MSIKRPWSPELSRRSFVSALGATVAAGAPMETVAGNISGLTQNVLALGQSVVNARVVSADVHTLQGNLVSKFGDNSVTPYDLFARAFNEASREDFASGTIVKVEGALLSKTEAEALAFLALT